jgi:peptidoglycan hydrolase-like protein with peptidoglycan-binding domain
MTASQIWVGGGSSSGAARVTQRPPPRGILALQRGAGNRAVARLVMTGEPIASLRRGLSGDALERAVKYVAERHYPRALIEAIQRVVGVVDDGVYGEISAHAAAAWQDAHGLSADGKVGPATLAAMGLASGAQRSGGETPPAAEPVAAETPQRPVAPVAGDLGELMTKPRLTSDEIVAARERIAGLPDEAQRSRLFEELQSKVTYHSQRDNVSVDKGQPIGDKMCNLTSLAMCLEYLGVRNPHPEMQFEDALEKLRVEKVGKPRTDVAGWGAVAKLMGVEMGFIPDVGAHDQPWYEANVRPHLASGEAVMLSIQGHICRLQEMTTAGLVADDPYGKSILKAGTERGWGATNARLGSRRSDRNAGEDITWPWSDVKRHRMKWIAWFRR